MNTTYLIKRAVEKKTEMKVAHFKKCPCCECEDLLKFEIDYFCMECDWNSILFDVNSGNFERRIGILNRDRAQARRSKKSCGVVSIADLITRKTCAEVQTRSSNEIIFQNKQISKIGSAK